MTHGLSTLVAVSLVWILPGALLWRILGGKARFGLDALALYATLGIDVLLLLGGFAFVGKFSIDTVVFMFLVAVFLLVGGYAFVYLRDVRSKGSLRSENISDSVSYLLLGAVLMGLIALVLTITETATIASYGDRWTYLAMIRNHLDAPRLASLSPFLKDLHVDWRLSFDAWGLNLALISKMARVEPVDLYSYSLPPLLVLISSFAYINLAKELFEESYAAYYAFLIQVVYYLSDMRDTDGMGFNFLGRIVEDKFAVLFVIYPLVLLLILRYLSTSRRSYLLAFGLTVVGAGLAHPLGPVFCAISCGAFAITRLYYTRSKEEFIKFIHIFTFIVVALAVPFLQRMHVKTFSFTSAVFTEELLQKALTLHKNTLLVFDLKHTVFMVHPKTLAHPLVVLAVLLTPLLLKYIRGSRAAQFLFSNMFVLLVMLYNPLTATLVGKLLTPWMTSRLRWILPISLVLGFLGHKAMAWITFRVSGVCRHSRHTILAVMALASVMLTAGFMWTRLSSSNTYFNWWFNRAAVSDDERSLMAYMRENVEPGSIVFAGPDVGSHIPGIMGKAYPVAFRAIEWNPPLAYEDLGKFYDQEYVDFSVLSILEKYDAQYVVLDAGSFLSFQFGRLPSIFSRVYGSETFDVYRIAPTLQGNQVILGNTLLVQRDLEEAIAQYEESLLRRGAENELAHLGLAKAYLEQGKPERAIAEAKKSVARSPDEVWPRFSLAKALQLSAEATGRLQEYEDLGRAYLGVIALNSNDREVRSAALETFIELGERYYDLGMLSEAAEAYQLILRLNANQRRQIYVRLAEVYERLGQAEEAVVLISCRLKLLPEWAEGHQILGRLYEGQGKLEQATAEYKVAIELNPKWNSLYRDLGRVYSAQNKQTDAIALYKSAARTFLYLAWPHFELGKIYLEQSNSDEK